MPEFFSFFVILFTAVLFSQFFGRMHVPWVVALILGGIVVGPNGLDFFHPDTTINFLAQIGLVFMMFMAGLETRLSDIVTIRNKIVVLSLFTGVLPSLVGIGIARYFQYDWPAAILLGIIFMSSAFALLIPTFQAIGIARSEFGRLIIGTTILIDAVSLLLLSVFLQIQAGAPVSGIILFYPFLVAVLAGLAWIIPKIRHSFGTFAEEQDLFEKELRFILMILIGLVVFFEFVGLHAIIAGFFAGLILARSVESRITKAKLHAISYGIFIPLFFVVVGGEVNLGVFFESTEAISVVFVVILGLSISKVISGLVAGTLLGYRLGESTFIGVSSLPLLSTALAIAFLGFNAGLLDQTLITATVALAVITSLTAPIVLNLLKKQVAGQQIAIHNLEELEAEAERSKTNTTVSRPGQTIK